MVKAVIGAVGDENATTAPSLSLLIAFLGDTGRWSGTPEELAASLGEAEQAAEAVSSPHAAALAELAEVEVDPAAEQAALGAVPMVRRAEALLLFLAPQRPITSSGALRRPDVLRAAELLGVDLGGRTPRSMWDIPALAEPWRALRDADLVELTASAAVLAPVAAGWLSGEPEQTLLAQRAFVGAFLTHLLTVPPAAPWLPAPMDGALPALTAAALDRPLPTAEVLPCAGQDRPQRDELLTAHDLFHRLVDERILVATDTVSAAPGLRGLLADLTAAVLRAMELVDDGSAALLALPPPDPAAQGRVWRLRVELEHADPPIWREVLLDPGTCLDQLHDIIQRLFDWEDSHLHDFVVDSPRVARSRFAPYYPDAEPSLFGDPPLDEARAQLSQLIGPRRGRLTYQYDFGDSWDHRVTVVGSQPADDAPVPQCTGGSGAAPHEDSGGVWGWAGILAAAADPRHPGHEEAREWLGLEPGKTIDPTAFDLEEVNGRLAVLRRHADRAGGGRPRRL
jgi:hypothetical protein